MTDLTGRTALVTGATSGIGEITARELARMGAHVIAVGRDPERTEATRERIREATGREVEVHLADLSSQAEIRRLAGEIAHERIDVLVNNAGAIYQSRKLTADGLEMTFAVNHLSYFLLTNLLLPKLGQGSRVVSVSSDAHRGPALDFDDLQAERSYIPLVVYGRSKLMNLLFTYELARRVEARGVTANAVHPGVVRSGFGHNDGGWFSRLVGMIGFLSLSPEQGASTSIHLAAAPAVEGVTGKYFVRSRERRSSGASRDEQAQARLWSISAEICGL